MVVRPFETISTRICDVGTSAARMACDGACDARTIDAGNCAWIDAGIDALTLDAGVCDRIDAAPVA